MLLWNYAKDTARYLTPNFVKNTAWYLTPNFVKDYMYCDPQDLLCLATHGEQQTSPGFMDPIRYFTQYLNIYTATGLVALMAGGVAYKKYVNPNAQDPLRKIIAERLGDSVVRVLYDPIYRAIERAVVKFIEETIDSLIPMNGGALSLDQKAAIKDEMIKAEIQNLGPRLDANKTQLLALAQLNAPILNRQAAMPQAQGTARGVLADCNQLSSRIEDLLFPEQQAPNQALRLGR